MPVYLDSVLLRSSQGHACICSGIGSDLSLWLALQRLQIIINPARQAAGESEVRNLDFNNRLKDELDLKDEDFVLFNTGTRGRNPEVVQLTLEQMTLVGMRHGDVIRDIRNLELQLEDDATLRHERFQSLSQNTYLCSGRESTTYRTSLDTVKFDHISLHSLSLRTFLHLQLLFVLATRGCAYSSPLRGPPLLEDHIWPPSKYTLL